MKILVDATAVREGSGGMTTYLRGLLEGWESLHTGDEFHVLGMRDLPAIESSVTGVVERLPGRGQLARIWGQQSRVPRLARSLQADAILATDPSIPLWPGRPPVVATVHDLRHLRQPGEFAKSRRVYRGVMWGQGLRRADALVANSHSTAEHVLEVCPGAEGRLHTIHFGCDHVLRWPQVDSTEEHAIAFAHWTNKRPDLAIAAWGLLRRERGEFGCALDIVGAPEADRQALRQLASEAGVDDLVRIHGFLTEDVYQALFASARLVVMPSTLEGFGFPVLEGMRLGIPSVCARGAGLEEAGGGWAFYADGWTPSAFADACGRALLDAGRRARAIEGGRRHAAGFTWRRTAEQVRTVVEDAVHAGDVTVRRSQRTRMRAG